MHRQFLYLGVAARAFLRLCVIWALGAALTAACGGGEESCTSSAQCPDGRVCFAGRCVPSVDGDVSEGVEASDGADLADGADGEGGPDVPAEAADAPDEGTPVGYGCSADLRSVLDASGNILETCPPEEGCFEGRCIGACEAAAFSRGNVGCEFFAPTPPSYPPALPPCHALFITNTWPLPAQITVTRGSETFDVTQSGRIVDNERPAADWDPVPAGGIPVDQVAVLFLSSHPEAIMPENLVPLTCPVEPAINAATAMLGNGIDDVFRIAASVPVSAYDIMPFGGARSHFPSAQLLLPSSAWDIGYVVIATPPGTYSEPGPLWLQIVGLEDATSVSVRPTVDLPEGGGLIGIGANEVGTMMVNSGQVIQWQLPMGSTDASGTTILADKSVAVLAGNRFLRLQPTPAPGGDSTHQQILPVRALGSDYVLAPWETRRADLAEESIPYRLVGAVDGTVLTCDPAVSGAPTTLEQGQVADFTAVGPVRIMSQDADHPFAVAQLMTTANVEGGSRPGATAPGYGPWLGDEEFVIVFPPAQFLSRYAFFTDPTYATTNLAIVRAGTDDGFQPVTVDCLGEVAGFRAVGSSGEYEVATADLVRADVGVGECANGRHIAESDGPFGIIVWGLDSYSSYAYPAGGNAAFLAELPPLM